MQYNFIKNIIRKIYCKHMKFIKIYINEKFELKYINRNKADNCQPLTTQNYAKYCLTYFLFKCLYNKIIQFNFILLPGHCCCCSSEFSLCSRCCLQLECPDKKLVFFYVFIYLLLLIFYPAIAHSRRL